MIYNDDYNNLGELGAIDEPMIQTAINDIMGIALSAKTINQQFKPNIGKVVGNSQQYLPNYQRMYSTFPK